MSIVGFDVSHHQDPKLFDWAGMRKAGVQFVIARASYGKRTNDAKFVEFAKLIRDNGFTFGAYHFYRQIHGAEEQLKVFTAQLERIGGLRAGDLFPILDMEPNLENGDGQPQRKLWNRACDEIGDALKAQFGGAILYYSSFFPEYLGARRDGSDDGSWKWIHEPGYFHWLCDYSVPEGSPRSPYTPSWALHQPKPRHSALYGKGALKLDHNIVNPACSFKDLLIKERTETGVSREAEMDVEDRRKLLAEIAEDLRQAQEGLSKLAE